jgi:hypothetical protein
LGCSISSSLSLQSTLFNCVSLFDSNQTIRNHINTFTTILCKGLCNNNNNNNTNTTTHNIQYN